MKKISLIRTAASFFYVGFFPVAPGTWASLIAMLIWLLLPVQSVIIRTIIVGLAFVTGLYVANAAEIQAGVDDPAYVVIDEVAGMWLALLLLPKFEYPQSFLWALIAFLIFRIFDITKIFPINRLEKMSGGFGIMLDDIAAGLFTAVLLNLIIWIV
ncbi:MAG: phosphatidylglycerophosphatase A family protein [Fidelibacterota bacterium]